MSRANEKITIVGAGPAGAFASMYLSRYKIPHTLIDKNTFPRDKICGDAISGKVVNLLAYYDPSLIDRLQHKNDAFQTNGIYFCSPSGKRITLPFPPASGNYPPGFVCPRKSFDQFLVEQLDQQYCNFLPESKITKIEQGTSSQHCIHLENDSQSLSLAPELIIAADGAQSIVKRALFSEKKSRNASAGLRLYAKGVKPEEHPSYIELHFLKRSLPGYFWIFPLNDGWYNIGMGMHSSQIKKKKINLKNLFREIITSDEHVTHRFTGIEEQNGIQGWSLPMEGNFRRLAGDGVLLTGDAGGLIDPFTGEGIAPAMLSGKHAALQAISALENNRFDKKFLRRYEKTMAKKLANEMKISYRLQQMTFYPRILRFIMDKAANNKSFQNTLYNMFTDINLRHKLTNPAFYLDLFKKN